MLALLALRACRPVRRLREPASRCEVERNASGIVYSAVGADHDFDQLVEALRGALRPPAREGVALRRVLCAWLAKTQKQVPRDTVGMDGGVACRVRRAAPARDLAGIGHESGSKPRAPESLDVWTRSHRRGRRGHHRRESPGRHR